MRRMLVLVLLIGGTILAVPARGAEVVLDRPSVAVVEARIVESSPGAAGELGIEQMLPFLEYFEGSKLPLVVVAVDYEGKDVTALVGDRLQGLNRIVFVNPARGKREVLQEIADASGGSILTPGSNWERPAEISTLIGDVASARIAPGILNLEVDSAGGSLSAGELDSLLGDTDPGGSAGSEPTSYPLMLVADIRPSEAGEPGEESLGRTSGGSLDSILGDLAPEEAAGEGDFCCQDNKSRWMEYRGLNDEQAEKYKADCRKGGWHEGRCPTDRRPWWECILTVMQQGGVDARYMLWGSDREAEEFCRRLPGVNKLNFVH